MFMVLIGVGLLTGIYLGVKRKMHVPTRLPKEGL